LDWAGVWFGRGARFVESWPCETLPARSAAIIVAAGGKPRVVKRPGLAAKKLVAHPALFFGGCRRSGRQQSSVERSIGGERLRKFLDLAIFS
jgi:hypothetical protein